MRDRIANSLVLGTAVGVCEKNKKEQPPPLPTPQISLFQRGFTTGDTGRGGGWKADIAKKLDSSPGIKVAANFLQTSPDFSSQVEN